MSKPSQPSRRLLIFQETRNPQNSAEMVYLPVNKLGLPVCGDGPELPSILELPLRSLRFFTELFNQPKYKGWYVAFFCFVFFEFNRLHFVRLLCIFFSVQGLQGQGLQCIPNKLSNHDIRAVLSAGPYHDTSEEGKFYAVVLEQNQVHTHGQPEGAMGSSMGSA